MFSEDLFFSLFTSIFFIVSTPPLSISNGIFWVVPFITQNPRKKNENTKNKESAGWNPCSTLPRPHTEPTEINGIHEKGAGAEGGMRPRITNQKLTLRLGLSALACVPVFLDFS